MSTPPHTNLFTHNILFIKHYGQVDYFQNPVAHILILDTFFGRVLTKALELNLDLDLAASGAVGGVIQHERGHAQRGGRSGAHLEHQVQENSAGVHLPVPGQLYQ